MLPCSINIFCLQNSLVQKHPLYFSHTWQAEAAGSNPRCGV
uniref:Uncharacterized protein n=1 Tax=Anguilla anguilla TaxID=7936 RepID=A0A0E9R5L4_ANGAN